MTRTNVGSPKGREPYGDGGPVVVVGITPYQGRRESRLQGQGGQVIGYSNNPGGMRNAERRNGAGCPPSHRRAGRSETIISGSGGGRREQDHSNGTSPDGLPRATACPTATPKNYWLNAVSRLAMSRSF